MTEPAIGSVLAGLSASVHEPVDHLPAAARHGLRYRCRRCDVYGYVAPGDALCCWVCEDATALEPR